MYFVKLITVLISLIASASIAYSGESTDSVKGDAVAGKERYLVNCFNCHGKTGKGMASFPPILGKDAEYISDRLTAYRAREKVGPNSAIMMSLASELSDDDIANLAVYISATFK